MAQQRSVTGSNSATLYIIQKKRERGTLQQQKQLREETENPIFVMDIPETYINSIQNAIQRDVNKEDDN